MGIICPKYIKNKINSRADHAARFTELDSEICDWMEKRGIDITAPQFSDHILTGAESLCNPYSSADLLIYEIENYTRNRREGEHNVDAADKEEVV